MIGRNSGSARETSAPSHAVREASDQFLIALILKVILVSGFLLQVNNTTQGSSFSLMGLGSQNQSMANSTAAVATDAFSQAYNPALMSFQAKSVYSVGFEGLSSWFQNINQVIVDTPNLGGAATTYGNVNTNVPDTDLVTFAYQAPLYVDERPLHLGVHVLTPLQHVLYINTPDPFEPGYSQYLADTQRFSAGLTLSKILGEHLSFGLGANLFFSQGITSKNRLPANYNSTNDLSAEIKPVLAPAAGVVYFSKDSAYKFGVSYRGKQDYQSNVATLTQLSLLNSPGELDFMSNGSVYYDPDTLIFAVGREDENWIMALSAQWELWNGFSGDMNHMTFQYIQGSFNQVLPSTPYQNIWSLHAGLQRKYAHSRVSGGYAYVPTPVPDQSGESNLIDSIKHELYAGYGWTFNRWFMDGILRLDGVVFFDYLAPKTITKTDSGAIGAPGYQIGGSMYGYGVTLTREY